MPVIQTLEGLEDVTSYNIDMPKYFWLFKMLGRMFFVVGIAFYGLGLVLLRALFERDTVVDVRELEGVESPDDNPVVGGDD